MQNTLIQSMLVHRNLAECITRSASVKITQAMLPVRLVITTQAVTVQRGGMFSVVSVCG